MVYPRADHLNALSLIGTPGDPCAAHPQAVAQGTEAQQKAVAVQLKEVTALAEGLLDDV